MPLVLVLLLAQGVGELTHFGNKWGWTHTDEAFVPQLVMYATPPNFYGNPGKVDGDIRLFLEDYGFNGFHVFVSCRWFDIGEPDCRQVKAKEPEFDPRTFEALEMLIVKTHAAGGMVHLWMWGDEERGQTPSAPKSWGGLDGAIAQKLERAIAERLGPLPGWSLGYGFDLDEWVTAPQIHAWRDRQQRILPRFHFLGGRPQGPNNGKKHDRFERWNRALDYASYEHHKPSYTVYVDALEANPDKPVMSEDRFRVLQSSDWKHYSPEEIRRGLWHSTLAGGVANIWGYLLDGGSHELGSAAFPNPAQIRTHFEFMRGRFLKNMARCSGRKAKPHRRTLCLGSDQTHFVFYKEATSRVELDLRILDKRQPAVAIDTKKPYAEIDLGLYAPGQHVWEAPYRSDWAIAVGRFDSRRTKALFSAESRPTPSDLTLRSATQDVIELVWTNTNRDADRFELERAEANGAVPDKFELIATMAPNQKQFMDHEVRSDTAYWYRIRTVTPFAVSPYSTAIRAFAGEQTALVNALSPLRYRVAPLQLGERYYIDRNYVIASYPSTLDGALILLTSNDDKLAEEEHFLSFTVTNDVTLFVGFDRRAKRIPYWLDEWERTGERIHVEGDAMRFLELYRRDALEGEVNLGGNSAAGADWENQGRSSYVVFVVPR